MSLIESNNHVHIEVIPYSDNCWYPNNKLLHITTNKDFIIKLNMNDVGTFMIAGQSNQWSWSRTLV